MPRPPPCRDGSALCYDAWRLAVLQLGQFLPRGDEQQALFSAASPVMSAARPRSFSRPLLTSGGSCSGSSPSRMRRRALLARGSASLRPRSTASWIGSRASHGRKAERLGDELVGVGGLVVARALGIGRPAIDPVRASEIRSASPSTKWRISAVLPAPPMACSTTMLVFCAGSAPGAVGSPGLLQHGQLDVAANERAARGGQRRNGHPRVVLRLARSAFARLQFQSAEDVSSWPLHRVSR